MFRVGALGLAARADLARGDLQMQLARLLRVRGGEQAEAEAEALLRAAAEAGTRALGADTPWTQRAVRALSQLLEERERRKEPGASHADERAAGTGMSAQAQPPRRVVVTRATAVAAAAAVGGGEPAPASLSLQLEGRGAHPDAVAIARKLEGVSA